MAGLVPRIPLGSPAGVSQAAAAPPRVSASFGGFSSGFMRGESTPVFQNWHPPARDPAEEVRSAYERAHGRAVDLIHNSGWITGAIDQAVADTVGSNGLRWRLMPDAKELGMTEDEATDWGADVERRFLLWATNPMECDIEGRRTFAQMQAASYRSWFGPGEILSESAWKRRPGHAYGTKVRLIPAHRLSQRTNNPRLVQGIQMDADWMATSYWFRRQTMVSSEEIEIEARDRAGRPRIVHVFDGVPGQYRGISPLVSALETARRFDQLTGATLTAALIRAVFAATIESQEPTAEVLKGLLTPKEQAEQESKGLSTFDVWASMNQGWYRSTNIDLGIHGRFAHLFPGQKMEFHSKTDAAGDFKEMSMLLLREIMRCIGCTFESGTGDYSGATYSSVRSATNTIWEVVLYRRKNIIAPFCQPHAVAWLEEDIARGGTPFPGGLEAFIRKRSAATRAEWIGSPKPEADNLKTAKANEVYRDMGVLTDEDICAQQGRDVLTVYQQRSREKKLRAKYDLPENGPAETKDPVVDSLLAEKDE